MSSGWMGPASRLTLHRRAERPFDREVRPVPLRRPACDRGLGLDQDTLDRLQTFVESLHPESGLDGISIAPPSHGTLATLDPAQLVTPPPNLETGHVPIVIGQY